MPTTRIAVFGMKLINLKPWVPEWRQRTRLALALCILSIPWLTEAVGTWTKLTVQPNTAVGPMLLLSDGTVMAQSYGDTNWYQLKPDIHGSYVNGSWTSLKPMNYSRDFYSSDVLTDGRVFVAGGEYSDGGWSTAEVYDPQANGWSLIPVQVGLLDTNIEFLSNGAKTAGFSDSASVVVANGNVLVSPVYPATNGNTVIYSPTLNTFVLGPQLTNGDTDTDEQSWVKLPDGSILTFDRAFNSQRYIPSLNQWMADAAVPIQMYDVDLEIGAGLLLPDGQAFYLGGTGHTLRYTPTGSTGQGTWTQGPDIPNSMQTADAPAAMMVNGKILCAVTAYPPASPNSSSYHTPVFFYEYDPVANSFATNVPSPTTGSSDASNFSDEYSMLDLPDGTVLFSDDVNVYVYQPDGSPLPAGKPTITSITANADGSFHLVGTGLNGISAGAAYGDDRQMDSNYPLVRLTDGSGNVYYARTYNWSSTGVQTGSTPVTTEFTLPTTVFAGGGTNYSLVVVANGIASDPVTFAGPVWVDFNTSVQPGNGTFATPYYTLALGVSAVPAGGAIFIKPGTSTETPTITKPMSIIAVGGAATVGQ